MTVTICANMIVYSFMIFWDSVINAVVVSYSFSSHHCFNRTLTNGFSAYIFHITPKRERKWCGKHIGCWKPSSTFFCILWNKKWILGTTPTILLMSYDDNHSLINLLYLKKCLYYCSIRPIPMIILTICSFVFLIRIYTQLQGWIVFEWIWALPILYSYVCTLYTPLYIYIGAHHVV